MTYARDEPDPRAMRLERPYREKPHLRLIHDDIAPRNVMIDERDPTVQDRQYFDLSPYLFTFYVTARIDASYTRGLLT